MGNGKTFSVRGWAWLAGLTLIVTFLAVTPVPSQAVGVASGDGILVVGAHPDDDIILAAGVTMSQIDRGGDVTVAIMTNGDRCESESQVSENYCVDGVVPNLGTTRQEEAVTAQKETGLTTGLGGSGDDNLIFLGYPNGFLSPVRYGDESGIPVLAHTQTYASYGRDDTDWHDSWSSGHVAYPSGSMAQGLLDDMVALIGENGYPEHIFTHNRWDRHPDHHATYLAVLDAVKEIQSNSGSAYYNPSYDPYIHTGLVHVMDSTYYNQWPALANPSAPVNVYPSLSSDTDNELVWDQRESFEVPASMQLSYDSGNNPKANAIEAHETQIPDGDGFIRRFAHKDEIFFVERLGAAKGMPDAEAVAEGGTLSVGASGVLANDVRGVQHTGVSTGYDPVELGPMSAELVSGPSHAASFSLNSDGSFTYIHDGSETTSDSFTYRPVQGAVDGLATTVTINVNPVNDAPTAIDDSYTLDNGATFSVPAAGGVLSNDSDPDSVLTASELSAPAHGSLTLNANGSFTYVHDGSATTSDSFTYQASDGQYSAAATVLLAINPKDDGGGGDPTDPLAVAVAGPSIGATGNTYVFTSTISGGTGTKTYNWAAKQSGNVVSTGHSQSFSFSSSVSGEYTIELTVTDQSGSKSASQAIKLMGDIGGSAFTDDIIWLAGAGITQGCNPPANDRYCPNDPVTRGQMAAFLVRFLDLQDIDPGVQFADISGSAFESNILKLATAGITKGCNPPANDLYCPNGLVTRGQMAAFLVRALDLQASDPQIDFVDDNNSVFEANIVKLATAGITKGCNPPANDRFCPNDYVTRGQMAAFLRRASGLSG